MSTDPFSHRTLFPANRAAAVQRLQAFVPRAGQHYARHRNTDYGPERRDNVSLLSPYLRHRLLDERETVAAALAAHGFDAAEKFIQEVLWRTYWKGWLQLRPAVWTRYLDSLAAARMQSAENAGLRQALAAAEAGRSGIEGFDDWARELVQTGYLHNHARMWFASIWIFTLRLPWALGADFFLRHLLDADPASNTLSWRWVAGLQTAGKTYAASADNIARCTDGRFQPQGLSDTCEALTEPPLPAAAELAPLPPYSIDTPSLLLVHAEDLNPQAALPAGLALRAAAVAGADALGPEALGSAALGPDARGPASLDPKLPRPDALAAGALESDAIGSGVLGPGVLGPGALGSGVLESGVHELDGRDSGLSRPDALRSSWPWGDKTCQFIDEASLDACARLQTGGLDSAMLPQLSVAAIQAAAAACGARQVLCMEAAVGPLADRLRLLEAELGAAGLPLRQLRNPWDARFWPQARRGFFPFKAGIADGLRALGVAGA